MVPWLPALCEEFTVPSHADAAPKLQDSLRVCGGAAEHVQIFAPTDNHSDTTSPAMLFSAAANAVLVAGLGLQASKEQPSANAPRPGLQQEA